MNENPPTKANISLVFENKFDAVVPSLVDIQNALYTNPQFVIEKFF